MPREVRGHAFIDAEDAGNLLQMLIVLSVADNRQDIAARTLLLVFAQYQERNIKQLDLRCHARLHRVCLNPGATIVGLHGVFGC